MSETDEDLLVLIHLRWILDRARATEPGEWSFRAREQLRGFWDGLPGVHRRLIAYPLDAADTGTWPVDRHRLRAVPADARRRLRAAADRLLRGELSLLGVDWPRGTLDAWGRDPVSGTRWPHLPARTVLFRGGVRDPKLAWEQLRLPHLQTLALAACTLDDDRAADAAHTLLRSWLRDDRPFFGLAYAAGIECAHRAVSLLVVAGLLGLDNRDAELARDLHRAVLAQVVWIDRYPSRFSSAGNHRLAELAALVTCACLSPAVDPGEDRDRWIAELEIITRRLILPDGGPAEQSPRYLGVSLEWLLVARRAAAERGIDLGIDERLAAGANFLRHLMDTGGGVPRIGDHDQSSVLSNPGAMGSMLPSVVGAVARTLRRPDLIPPRYGGDQRSALLGLAPLRARRVRRASATFPGAGLTAIRWRAGRQDALLVLDHGPLGLAPVSAHGHADALAIWLHHGDRPLLVDSGTYRYSGAPPWRRWLRSTAAHNTATVDGLDQAEQLGSFLWSSTPQVHIDRLDLATRTLTASHDGYHARAGVIHRRRVTVPRSKEIEVEDVFEGTGDHEIAVRYHLAPDLSVVADEPAAWTARVGDQPVLRLELLAGDVTGWVAQDSTSPGPGANCPSYNRIVAAPCLCLTGPVSLPARVVVRILLEPGRTSPGSTPR